MVTRSPENAKSKTKNGQTADDTNTVESSGLTINQNVSHTTMSFLRGATKGFLRQR